MSAAAHRFWPSVAVVLTGTAAAQAIPLAGSLLLARLYAPADFGLYSAWLGMVFLAAVLLTARLEMALALEPEGEPRRLAVQAILFTLIPGAALLVLATLGAAGFSLRIAAAPRSMLLTFTPTALFVAATQTWQCWAAAEGKYRDLSVIRIAQAAAITVAQVSLGVVAPSAETLAWAHCAGVVMGVAVAALRLPLGPLGPIRSGVFAFWKRHRRFPILSLPAASMNTAAAQLPVLIVATRFGGDVAGLLALTTRTLGAPISLLGSSVLDVFRRSAGASFREKGDCRSDYLRTFKVLAAGSAIILLPIGLLGETLFGAVFGDKWTEAGTMAVWLTPMFALRFVASPLSYTFYAAGKQHADLVWQLALLMVTLAALRLPSHYAAALQWYSFGYSMLYVLYLFLSYRFSLGTRQ